MSATYEISLDVLTLRIAQAAYHYSEGARLVRDGYDPGSHFAEGMTALREAYPIAERLRCEAWTAELGVEHTPGTLVQAVEMIERMLAHHYGISR